MNEHRIDFLVNDPIGQGHVCQFCGKPTMSHTAYKANKENYFDVRYIHFHCSNCNMDYSKLVDISEIGNDKLEQVSDRIYKEAYHRQASVNYGSRNFQLECADTIIKEDDKDVINKSISTIQKSVNVLASQFIVDSNDKFGIGDLAYYPTNMKIEVVGEMLKAIANYCTVNGIYLSNAMLQTKVIDNIIGSTENEKTNTNDK